MSAGLVDSIHSSWIRRENHVMRRGRWPRGGTLLATAWMLLVTPAASAQQAWTPVQITGELSALGLNRGSGEGTGSAGLGVRVDLRVTGRVDVESRLTWFPANLVQEFQAQGGQTLQAGAGVRGKFLRSRVASVYGLLMPGLLRFTNTVTGTIGPLSVTGGATHFALDTGVGVEFYPTSRWTVRSEVTGPLYGAPGAELGRSNPSPTGAVLTLSTPARFVNPWQVSAGVGYRLGSLRNEGVEAPVAGRWEIGGQVTQMTSTDALAVGVSFERTPALGAFASYRLSPAVYADAALNAFVRPAPERTPFDGGYLLQGLGGVKLGVRKDRYGIFVKTRAGVNSHSGAFASFDASSRSVTIRRTNAVAIDLGGVFERYIGRSLLVRFDGGDIVSVFRATTINEDGVRVPVPAPSAAHNLQMTVGVGWKWRE